MIPSCVCRVDDESELDPAARKRVLLAADLKCADCGAEHDRTVLRNYFDWPARRWRPHVIGQTEPVGWTVSRTAVVVVATSTPWSGKDEDLTPLCMGCIIARDVVAARVGTVTPKGAPKTWKNQSMRLF